MPFRLPHVIDCTHLMPPPPPRILSLPSIPTSQATSSCNSILLWPHPPSPSSPERLPIRSSITRRTSPACDTLAPSHQSNSVHSNVCNIKTHISNTETRAKSVLRRESFLEGIPSLQPQAVTAPFCSTGRDFNCLPVGLPSDSLFP